MFPARQSGTDAIAVHSQLFDYWSRPNGRSTRARARNTVRLFTNARFQNHQLGPGEHLVCENPQGHRWNRQNMRGIKPKFVARCSVSPVLGRLAGVTATVQPSHIGEYAKDHLVWVRIWCDVF